MKNSHRYVLDLVDAESTVLDLGCGDGTLLRLLKDKKEVRGYGIDHQEAMVRQTIAQGISVFQGDLNEGLKGYADHSYDYVILSHTLQEMSHPDKLLREMLRVGKKIVVNIPNFGHIMNRFQLTFKGRMPVNRNISYQWYDTPNIHFCTRSDFMTLCHEVGAEICAEIALSRNRRIASFGANLFATELIFLLAHRDQKRQ